MFELNNQVVNIERRKTECILKGRPTKRNVNPLQQFRLTLKSVSYRFPLSWCGTVQAFRANNGRYLHIFPVRVLSNVTRALKFEYDKVHRTIEVFETPRDYRTRHLRRAKSRICQVMPSRARAMIGNRQKLSLKVESDVNNLKKRKNSEFPTCRS